MKQIGFFGVFDKKDLILNIAKVLASLNAKPLVVDATSLQRMRYIVPNVSNNRGMSYVSEYAGVDCAVGFMNLGQIAAYLGTNNTLPYDIILIDSDNIQTMASYAYPRLEKIFFVTSYDQYEINKCYEILSAINQPMKVTKVLFSADLETSQERALSNVLSKTSLQAEDIAIQFADSNIDRKEFLQNQLTKNITLKHCTAQYKGSLEYITSIISEGLLNQADIKRIIKKM